MVSFDVQNRWCYWKQLVQCCLQTYHRKSPGISTFNLTKRILLCSAVAWLLCFNTGTEKHQSLSRECALGSKMTRQHIWTFIFFSCAKRWNMLKQLPKLTTVPPNLALEDPSARRVGLWNNSHLKHDCYYSGQENCWYGAYTTTRYSVYNIVLFIACVDIFRCHSVLPLKFLFHFNTVSRPYTEMWLNCQLFMMLLCFYILTFFCLLHWKTLSHVLDSREGLGVHFIICYIAFASFQTKAK